jgi:hypothetical protein
VVGHRRGHLALELGIELGALALVDPLPQVLGRVVGVLGDEDGVVAAHVVGVVVLDDVAAGGLGHDDLLAVAHRGRQHLDVLGRLLGEVLDVALVQPRRTAAHLTRGQRALDAVALVDPHEVAPDVGGVVFDEAGREQGDAALRLLEARRLPLLDPGAEPLAGVRRKHALGRDADRLLEQPPGQRAGGGRHLVGQRRDRGVELAHEVGASESLVGEL